MIPMINEPILCILDLLKGIPQLQIILHKQSKIPLWMGFLLKFLKFTMPEVGYINKVLGVIATLIGIFFGGLIISKIKLFRALLLFGILQAVTNLLYAALAVVGKNYVFACSAIFIENLCSGLGTAAFTTLLMNLCNKKFTATQYAIFSALASVGRIYFGPVCAALVAQHGWTVFYCISFVVSLPGLVLLLWLRGALQQLMPTGAVAHAAQEEAHQVPQAAVGVQVIAR
jgi:PAT family beta-lactamase induction signal transducer AmpG